MSSKVIKMIICVIFLFLFYRCKTAYFWRFDFIFRKIKACVFRLTKDYISSIFLFYLDGNFITLVLALTLFHSDRRIRVDRNMARKNIANRGPIRGPMTNQDFLDRSQWTMQLSCGRSGAIMFGRVGAAPAHVGSRVRLTMRSSAVRSSCCWPPHTRHCGHDTLRMCNLRLNRRIPLLVFFDLHTMTAGEIRPNIVAITIGARASVSTFFFFFFFFKYFISGRFLSPCSRVFVYHVACSRHTAVFRGGI